MIDHPVTTREEWLVARRKLLAEEKAFTRQRDALSASRRALPWVRVDKDYAFDGPGGRVALADLFAGRSQLIVYHFMFDPGWKEGCRSCSLIAEGFDGIGAHLAARDVTLVAVSRAPYEKLAAFRRRMGWRFGWVSSFPSDFNRDFHVTFTEAERGAGTAFYNFASQSFPAPEAPGLSVFFRDADGAIYHTYSCYARGLDALMGVYQFLDVVPKGRDEDPKATMSWVRHHDRYGAG